MVATEKAIFALATAGAATVVVAVVWSQFTAFRDSMRRSLPGPTIDMLTGSMGLDNEPLERTRGWVMAFDWAAFWWLAGSFFACSWYVAYSTMKVTMTGFLHLRYDVVVGAVLCLLLFLVLTSAERHFVRLKLRVLTGRTTGGRKS